MHGNEDINDIIIKICDYVLDIIYDNNQNESLDSNIKDDLLLEDILNEDDDNTLNNSDENDIHSNDNELIKLN